MPSPPLNLRYCGPYELLEPLGQGQFGQVYKARHQTSGECFALKKVGLQGGDLRQFLHEFQILIRMNHPNVVTCYGLECTATGRYFVLEYCPQGTLRDLLSRGSVNLNLALKLIGDVLDGLIHIHQQGIIHRDLKPENVLLKQGPTGLSACISDFGIAWTTPSLPQGASQLGATGSPAYMAPERFYGQDVFASDLYAVGVMLYELLTADRPFGGRPADLMTHHFHQAVTFPAHWPFWLRTLIDKALRKLPQHRYRSAQEMRKAVQLAVTVTQATQNHLDGLPTV